MKNYLLILGCSNRKNPVQTKVKPLDLYTLGRDPPWIFI